MFCMSGVLCSKSVTWKYRLEENHSWDSGEEVCDDYYFFDRKRRLRLVIEKSGRITVMKGYSWNGCSPKFCFFDILFGTPDGVVYEPSGRPKAYFATMIHDVLYQFLHDCLPYSRRTVDGFFLRLLKESEFRPRWIYWIVVRGVGGISRMFTRRKRDWDGLREKDQCLVQAWDALVAKRQATKPPAEGGP